MSAREIFDVIVIGGGPAGYPAAIRAGQNGLSVACIDEWKNLDGSHAFGGTCLNAGCIPSKALLESSELLHRAQEEFAHHGIRLAGLEMDIEQMQRRKQTIVREMTQGLLTLFKAAKVTALPGHGRLLPDRQVEYLSSDGHSAIYAARHVVLASGSEPAALASVPVDGKFIIDSRVALELAAVPRRLGVIGAGAVGLELGSVWRRLGSDVLVLEALETFLPAADQQLAMEALQALRTQGIDIRLGAKLIAATVKNDMVAVTFQDATGQHTALLDRLLVATGRRPFTRALLAEGTGVELDAHGFVQVDGSCRTTAEHVWAIGDVVRGPMLAHKGKEEGTMVADLIAGRRAEVNYAAIPSVIYTAPEIAWVGQSEQQLKASGRPYRVGRFPFSANGRARAMQASAGFCKVLAASDDDELLGVHIIGPLAGELIAEAVLATEYRASSEDLQRTMHAHPTLSEAVHEAALNVDRRSIDYLNR
jgi:dihydrolipoamide dehydrogenase